MGDFNYIQRPATREFRENYDRIYGTSVPAEASNVDALPAEHAPVSLAGPGAPAFRDCKQGSHIPGPGCADCRDAATTKGPLYDALGREFAEELITGAHADILARKPRKPRADRGRQRGAE